MCGKQGGGGGERGWRRGWLCYNNEMNKMISFERNLSCVDGQVV